MDPAKKSARFARGEATVISKVLGLRRVQDDSEGCGCMCGTAERGELVASALVGDVFVYERLRTARASVCGRRRKKFV